MIDLEIYTPKNPEAYNELLKKFKHDIEMLYVEVYGCMPSQDYYMSSTLERLGREGDNLGKRLRNFIKK
jgi:hypothetical protein